MKEQLLIAVKMMLVFTVITGIIYPLATTGFAQVLFHSQANGSLVRAHGHIAGSRLIGQTWTGPRYFHGRPSANGYNGLASGGSNFGPTNRAYIEKIRQRAAAWQKRTGSRQPIPADLVEASFSGLDPDISPGAAFYQAPRVARARHLSLAKVQALIRRHTHGRTLGMIGSPAVNVLQLNLALDRLH